MTQPQDQSMSGGQDNQAGSAGGSNDQESARKDVVQYETYQRVLSEKKKRDMELSETTKQLQDLQNQLKQRQEEELRQKEDYKKLLELRENELTETRTKLNEFTVMQRVEKKAQAFVNAVGGLKKQEYMNLVDFDRIILTDDGTIDEMSLEKYKEEWVQKFPETLTDRKVNNIPATSPQSAIRPADDKRALLERITKSGLL